LESSQSYSSSYSARLISEGLSKADLSVSQDLKRRQSVYVKQKRMLLGGKKEVAVGEGTRRPESAAAEMRRLGATSTDNDRGTSLERFWKQEVDLYRGAPKTATGKTNMHLEASEVSSVSLGDRMPSPSRHNQGHHHRGVPSSWGIPGNSLIGKTHGHHGQRSKSSIKGPDLTAFPSHE